MGWILGIFWIWIKNNSTERWSNFQLFQQKAVEKFVENKNSGWNHIKSQHFSVKTGKAKVLNWFFNEKKSITRLKVLKTQLKMRKTFFETLNFTVFLQVERLSTNIVWNIELAKKQWKICRISCKKLNKLCSTPDVVYFRLIKLARY